MEKKKYFISVDLEGVTDVTAWCETEKGQDGYERSCLQMTSEAAAACRAVLEAGHDAVVRDGHDSARNLRHELLPQGVKLMRGWACHPGSMMAGIDGSYAGAIYIGYHAPGGSNGSPLAHTMNYKVIRSVKINGKLASEFTMNSLYAAAQGVPSVFISGDASICTLAEEEVPGIGTVAVKECRGNSTFNLHPEDACSMIQEEVAKALRKEVAVRRVDPELELEVSLTSHQAVRKALMHPLIRQIGDSTVCYKAHSPRELNAILDYIIG